MARVSQKTEVRSGLKEAVERFDAAIAAIRRQRVARVKIGNATMFRVLSGEEGRQE